MSKRDINAGDTFGRWTVVRRADNYRQCHRRFLCRCQCGAERVVLAFTLTRGGSLSCGCLRGEVVARLRAKLRAEDVAEIRKLAGEGVAGKELAGRFGVSGSTVSQILTGKTWKGR